MHFSYQREEGLENQCSAFRQPVRSKPNRKSFRLPEMFLIFRKLPRQVDNSEVEVVFDLTFSPLADSFELEIGRLQVLFLT
jgi:hypothetical protein